MATRSGHGSVFGTAGVHAADCEACETRVGLLNYIEREVEFSENEFDFALDVIEQAHACLARLAVRGVHPRMPKTNRDRFEWPFLACVYIATVIEVHAPSAARSRSYGLGPVSVPPTATGSSAVNRCCATEIVCAKPAALPWTVTVRRSASVMTSPRVDSLGLVRSAHRRA